MRSTEPSGLLYAHPGAGFGLRFACALMRRDPGLPTAQQMRKDCCGGRDAEVGNYGRRGKGSCARGSG